MLENSESLGRMQLQRSEASWKDRITNELKLKWNVWRHGTLPVLWYATMYDYVVEVKTFIASKESGSKKVLASGRVEAKL